MLNLPKLKRAKNTLGLKHIKKVVAGVVIAGMLAVSGQAISSNVISGIHGVQLPDVEEALLLQPANVQGLNVASHYSHSSHASHASHYSHYSGRY